MFFFKKGKLLLLMTTAVAITLTSCIRGVGGVDKGDGITEVVMSFASDGQAGTRSVTEGDASERRIHSLDLLVFDANGKFVERRTAQKVNNQDAVFKATMMPGVNMKIHFLANCHYLLNSFNSSHFENKSINLTIDDIRALLIDGKPADIVGMPGSGLPMWAYTSSTINKDQVNDLGLIKLLRSAASVDVKCKAGMDTDDFTLTSLRLYFAADRGYLTVDPAHIISGRTGAGEYMNGNVSAPEVPAAMKTLDQKAAAAERVLLYTQPDDMLSANAILYKMYMYDNDAPKVTTAGRRATRVVIGGRYAGGEETYYPVDFVDPADGKTFLDIRRNYKYEFMINSVGGPGYKDPDIAAEAFPINMNVELIPWVLVEHPHIFADGPKWITVERKAAYLARSAGSADRISMASNIKMQDFNLEFETDKNGAPTLLRLTNDEDKVVGILLMNDRFLMELVGKEAPAGSELEDYFEVDYIWVRALGDYSTTDPGANTDKVIITTGYSRIRFEVDIFQTDGDSTWVPGGNQTGPIGG